MARYEELGFSLHRLTPRRDYALHTHDYSELEIILSGSAINSINGKSFPIRTGDVFVVGKGATHEITQIDGLELYNIGFNQSALRGIGQDLLEMPGFHALFLQDSVSDPNIRRLHLPSDQMQHVCRLLEEMEQEYQACMSGFQTSLLCNFALLLLLLSRSHTQDLPVGGTWQAAAAAAKMERDYPNPISMQDLAQSVYLSERHFRRQFEKAYGLSPSEYLLNLRLNAACRLLLCEDLTVTHTAMACGFSDGNYFSRMFHRKYGMSPTAYRRLHNPG